MSNDTAKEQIFNIQKNIFAYFTDTNQSYSKKFYDSIKTNVNSSRWHFARIRLKKHILIITNEFNLNRNLIYKEVRWRRSLNLFVLP